MSIVGPTINAVNAYPYVKAPPSPRTLVSTREVSPSPPKFPPALSPSRSRSRRSGWALPPLDLSIPPDAMRPGRGRDTPDGSPDSNDLDHEQFITPAASARPSIISPIVSDGSGGAGLGINMGGDGRGLGAALAGLEAERVNTYYEHIEMLQDDETYGKKPPLLRSHSSDQATTSRTSRPGHTHTASDAHAAAAETSSAAMPQPPWQAVNTRITASDRGPQPSSYSTARSPSSSPIVSSFAALPGLLARARKVSPTSMKRFSDQQDAYIPAHTTLESNTGSVSRSFPTIQSPETSSFQGHADTARSRIPLQSVPANIPTSPETYSAFPSRWGSLTGGNRRVRTISGNEKAYGLLGQVQPKRKLSDSQAYWLGLYFVFNLGLTLFNKYVLVSFPFPYTLTGLHALSGCVGCWVALERGSFTPARLTERENLTLAAFSVLYTINIAVSNISLQLVTVPFHQVVRASTPFFTILTSAILLRTRFSISKMIALLPVVAGVGLATYGDYYFTAWGLVLTLLGTLLAAMKTVVTNLIQTGGGGRLKLHPLDLLMRMSPLAFVQCVIYGWYTGELDRVRMYGATQMTRGKAFALLINGIIACGLNIVSFTANKKSGPLTMTVSANCKQVITIALAVILFDLHITLTNAAGILLTLVGGAWYGYAEFREKKRRQIKLERA